MSLETEFLVNCCQSQPKPEIVERLRHFIKVSSPQELIKTSRKAHEHGVIPIVHESILAHASDIIPAEVFSDLQKNNREIVMRNMRMSAELNRVIKLIEDADTKVLAFKGPLLAHLAYGDISYRQYGDLDLLVELSDLKRIVKLLEDHGFKRTYQLNSYQEQLYARQTYDIKLTSPNVEIYFELHWALFEEDYPIQVDLDKFFTQTQEIKIKNQSITTFSSEYLLFYLCLHGSKHLWERIGWVKDIDMLIRNQPIDWGIIENELKNTKTERMFYLGLHLTQLLFNTPLPVSVSKCIKNNTRLIQIAEFITSNWNKNNNTQTNLRKLYIKLKLLPKINMKFKYLYKIIIKPTLNEYQYIDLPASLYWLYYFIRPYLLIKKYLGTG